MAKLTVMCDTTHLGCCVPGVFVHIYCGVPLPCDLFLDCFRVRFGKQVQQRTAEVVRMTVWVPQLIGDSIEEQVPPCNTTPSDDATTRHCYKLRRNPPQRARHTCRCVVPQCGPDRIGLTAIRALLLHRASIGGPQAWASYTHTTDSLHFCVVQLLTLPAEMNDGMIKE
jgi:hypothetical protein